MPRKTASPGESSTRVMKYFEFSRSLLVKFERVVPYCTWSTMNEIIIC
jgi:hypothetical protein